VRRERTDVEDVEGTALTGAAQKQLVAPSGFKVSMRLKRYLHVRRIEQRTVGCQRMPPRQNGSQVFGHVKAKLGEGSSTPVDGDVKRTLGGGANEVSAFPPPASTGARGEGG